MLNNMINLAYLVASILFILGLKGLTHPRTAVRGNQTGAFGMLLAIVAVLLTRGLDYQWILVGLVIGGGIGALLAKRVQMTGMPELVALFNGSGGLASILVAGAAVYYPAIAIPEGATFSQLMQANVATGVAGIIGGVTFFGSIIAWIKLSERALGGNMSFPGLKIFNALVFVAAIVFAVLYAMDPSQVLYYWALVALASVLGVTLTIPIGGADMPVVIALLNSYSGLAGAATGFVLSNSVLIIAGSLVGASGLILTAIMCKAMNRSLANVLFGVMAEGEIADADEVYAGKIKATSADEIAMLLDGVQRVVIVPGYGMAVAQAQHAVRDMANLLEGMDIQVEYAVHPVAGRMPGHMNVLLAEADVPYEQLKEMDEINPSLEQVDLIFVVGANDVVNPDARTNPDSPIAGMPIINVDLARTVVVIKRSLSPGFAGIPNPLFAMDNTLMFFNDGKKAFEEISAAIKENM
ncbi:MAG: NAD(P)(+) transhydrogenase (Re/Si-specific) subunit beta [Candidatus Krumholzibacteria bacterium]|jgi:NAD(P) transhydrogenase subunit beta|nr:NAD(P)(+) transhydrogenase (Re/Si-specific) subunit beta [Candidatus Krumholzibacteria bacterium]MDP6796919.1 NAD(P)(+) transhydrogenase (Re/Si-specific) subunit beta [Candidatus Krumholzibacteria bacterium]MDP7021434.1 NAD(P)(+) transhydrogenase (Re/Si-specific) subunit beta [Candidatus Krumholzibacteria bacterium]